MVFLITKEKELIIDKQDIVKKKEFLRKNKNPDQYFSTFPKFYINLDRCQGRKSNFVDQMKEYKIQNYERVKAVDGNDIINKRKGTADQFKYQINFPEKNKDYKPSELAITLSHIKAMLNTTQPSIIMEDDIEMILVPHWRISFQKLINMIPKDCDIFLLANRKKDVTEKIKIEKVRNKKDFTGVCYIVTDKGREKVKQFIKNDVVIFDFEPIFDLSFLERFEVYTANTTFFLLDNMVFDSTHIDHNETYDCKRKSLKVLDKYYSLIKEKE
jgi:hypothetical protein